MECPSINKRSNRLVIDDDNKVQWNEVPVTLKKLEILLRQSAEMEEEPVISFEMSPLAEFDVATSVLALVRESGITRFGFVGNERAPEPEPT